MAQPEPISHPAARSVRAFGLYLTGTGTLLLLAPALLLAPLALPVPLDVWIRVVGVLALALGATDVLTAHTGTPPQWRATVWRRLAAGAALLGLVITGIAPPAVTLFAAIDIAAACWTAWALRSVGPQPTATRLKETIHEPLESTAWPASPPPPCSAPRSARLRRPASAPACKAAPRSSASSTPPGPSCRCRPWRAAAAPGAR